MLCFLYWKRHIYIIAEAVISLLAPELTGAEIHFVVLGAYFFRCSRSLVRVRLTRWKSRSFRILLILSLVTFNLLVSIR